MARESLLIATLVELADNLVDNYGSPRVCVGDFDHQAKLVVGSSMVSPPQQR